jgi:hypothetical protein
MAFYSPRFEVEIPDVAALIAGIVLVVAAFIELVVYFGSKKRIVK